MNPEKPKREITFKKNEEITLNIDDVGNNGEGIGHLRGYTFFVKGALPGEKIKARVMKQKKSYGYARLSEILTPSPNRVKPVCPAAGVCGGCTLQHLSYEEQLRHKEKKVRDCLTRIGGVDLSTVEWLPILGMTEGKERPWHYRNKAQFPVRADKKGQPVTGFFAGRSHSLIPVSSCPIQHPVMNEAAECVIEFMREFDILPYEEETHTGLVRHIYVRRGHHTGEVMVCLIINGDSLPYSDRLVERLLKIEGMASILFNVNKERTNVILGSRIYLLWGKRYIEDRIGDIHYRISPESFYQVNPAQTKRLYETVLLFADLKGEEKVWDLYCGIGTISLFLARYASHVFGVEIVPEAVENARENAKQNGIDNVSFVCGAAEDVDAGQDVDVIVVDPPRKGCDTALLDTMVKMQPEKIVYVSCEPATLARDLKYLGERGYAVRKARACDMFPQGGHVEGVCLLSRVDNNK